MVELRRQFLRLLGVLCRTTILLFLFITGPPTHCVGGGKLVTVAGVCRRHL